MDSSHDENPFQILEVKPTSMDQIPVDTRVCVFWSQAYSCLFPGTVEETDEPMGENTVQVLLDDGDQRQVELSKVRMLPKDYRKVGKLSGLEKTTKVLLKKDN